MNEQELTPCPHTRSAIHSLSQGKPLNPVLLAYLKAHLRQCGQCKRTFEALTCYHRAVRATLRYASLSPDAMISAEFLPDSFAPEDFEPSIGFSQEDLSKLVKTLA